MRAAGAQGSWVLNGTLREGARGGRTEVGSVSYVQGEVTFGYVLWQGLSGGGSRGDKVRSTGEGCERSALGLW